VSIEFAPAPTPSRFGAGRIAVLALSVGVLAGVPLWRGLSRPAANVGTVPSAPGQQTAAGQVRFDPTAPSLGTIQVRSARLKDQRSPSRAPRPVVVSIPAIGLNATVIPVGIDQPTGSMQIPADIRTVGWYRYGSAPNQPGSTLLVGHVDSDAQGAGAFFRLQALNPGATIAVRTASGSIVAYRVVARRLYPKSGLPANIFTGSGSPTLTLITCGGAFDPVTRHYAENVVIYAVPGHG
jgi:sortase (surface protein transpeptidase)